MWICLNDAFVSAVQDRDDPDKLWVRARNREHLRNLFPKKAIIEKAGTDYACRVFVSKGEFTDVVAKRIAEIDYGNFKNSVEEPRLHNLYGQFWQLHWNYQQKTIELSADRSRHFSWGAGDVEHHGVVEPDEGGKIVDRKT